MDFTEFFSSPTMVAAAIVLVVLGIVAIVKAPELLVMFLVAGHSFISFAGKLVGLTLERRTFGMAGALLFVPLVVLFLMMRMMRTREDQQPIFGRQNVPWILVTFVMGCLLLVGLTYTLAPNYGAQKTREYFVFGMAPMLLAFIFVRDRSSVQRLLWWIVIACVAMIGLVTFYAATHGGLEGALMFGKEETAEEMGGLELTGHLALSNCVLLLMGVLLAWAAGHREMKWKLLPVAYLPVGIFYILHAGTRSNLLAFLAVCSVGFYLTFKDRKGLLILGLFLTLILGVVFALTAAQEVQDRMFTSWVAEDTGAGYGGAYRLGLIKHAPAHFEAAPIFGHGTGGWVMAEDGVDQYDYPHNMFIEELVDHGLVGIALLLTIWGIVAWRVWRILKTAELGTELYGMAVFGMCLLFFELFTGLSHFGLAHHSCTLLLNCALILRCTFLLERAEEEKRGFGLTEDGTLGRTVLEPE